MDQNKSNNKPLQEIKDKNQESKEEYVEVKIDKYKVFKQNLSDAIARLFPKDINRTRIGVPPGLHLTSIMGHRPHSLNHGGSV